MFEDIHPGAIIKLIEHFENRTNRVRVFVNATYIATGEPGDEIELESIYEQWKRWRSRFPMPEAEFRTHLRECFDVFDDVLVGYRLGAPTPPLTKAHPRINMQRLRQVLPLCHSIKGLADELNMSLSRFEDALDADPELNRFVREGLKEADKRRANPAPGPEEVARARQAWNFSMPKRHRTEEQKLATALGNGFTSHDDYREAVQRKKIYRIALRQGHPEVERYHREWLEAEGKKRRGVAAD